jgi:hypothetical protein
MLELLVWQRRSDLEAEKHDEMMIATIDRGILAQAKEENREDAREIMKLFRDLKRFYNAKMIRNDGGDRMYEEEEEELQPPKRTERSLAGLDGERGQYDECICRTRRQRWDMARTVERGSGFPGENGDSGRCIAGCVE